MLEQWTRILRRAVRAYARDNCSSYAAAIAYFALLSLFPLTVFAASLAGFTFKNDPSVQDKVIDTLMRNLPLSDTEGRDRLRDILSAVTRNRAGLGVLGAVTAMFTASVLFGALRTALNMVFRVTRPRPIIQGKLIDIAMTLGFGLLILVSILLTAAIAIAQQYSEQWFGGAATVVSILLALAYFFGPSVVSVFVFMLLYRSVPRVDIRWRSTVPGALFAAVAFEALKIGATQFVAYFSRFDAVYGTLGFIVLFMVFAYFSAQCLLAGAEITRSYVEVTTGMSPIAQSDLHGLPLPQQAQAIVKGWFVAPPPTDEAAPPVTAAGDDPHRVDPPVHLP